MGAPCRALATLSASAVAAAALTWALRKRWLRRRKADEPLRDLAGYGRDPPRVHWPNGALVALNFALNVEEGAEPCMPDGDSSSTAALCECGSEAPPGIRDLAAESMFEYGSRCGIWRVLRALEKRGLPATVFACAAALERLPELAKAVRESPVGLDVCCHGWRWEDHIAMEEEEERLRIKRAVESLKRTLGQEPVGWYCRTAPSTNTRRLLVEHGGFLYDSDAYNDDLPYWTRVPTADGTAWHLVVPYTLCNNDSKFAPGRAFSLASDFFTFMRDSLETLVAEARETGCPKMMSVGLHMRLIGHPARIAGLHQFLDFVKGLGEETVWVCRRADIARLWLEQHPPPACKTLGGSSCGSSRDLKCNASIESGPRLLVTGGAGFVLSNLVHLWLTSNEESTCVIFDLVCDREARALLAPFGARLRFFEGDVTSVGAWARLAAEHGTAFTHVVSGAAVTPTAEKERADPAGVLHVNVDGLLRCLEWARNSLKELKRVIYISSDVAIGGLKGGADCYGMSKAMGEAVVHRWRVLFNMDAVAVRLGDVYGRLDRDTLARGRHNAPYYVCRRALRGERPRVAARSLDEPGWDYVDATSVARGLLALLKADTCARSLYHLALGRAVSHRELLEAVAASTGVQLEAELVEPGVDADLRSLPELHWLREAPMDVAPMKEEFGWEAAALAQGIREYVSWLRG